MSPLPDKLQSVLDTFDLFPDPSDRTKFHFDYELDGKRARTEVRLRDPDPTSTVPDWYQVEVGHGWK